MICAALFFFFFSCHDPFPRPTCRTTSSQSSRKFTEPKKISGEVRGLGHAARSGLVASGRVSAL
jgi:hypothetical protein